MFVFKLLFLNCASKPRENRQAAAYSKPEVRLLFSVFLFFIPTAWGISPIEDVLLLLSCWRLAAPFPLPRSVTCRRRWTFPCWVVVWWQRKAHERGSAPSRGIKDGTRPTWVRAARASFTWPLRSGPSGCRDLWPLTCLPWAAACWSASWNFLPLLLLRLENLTHQSASQSDVIYTAAFIQKHGTQKKNYTNK